MAKGEGKTPEEIADIMELATGTTIGLENVTVDSVKIKGGEVQISLSAPLRGMHADLDAIRRATHEDFRCTVTLEGSVEQTALLLPSDDAKPED